MVAPKKINMGMIQGDSLVDSATETMSDWGVTDLYSTGDRIIDEYLGNSEKGGYGRRGGGYEIVTIFGDTGMNKSTFATSMILSPAENGVQVAYFALEDDPKDVVKRIIRQCDNNLSRVRKITSNILFLPENDGYTLEAMAEAIEKTFSIADIIVVDVIQFIYESSVTEKGETEFNRQRLFMRQMNNIMKRTNKTLILVSHTSKGQGKAGTNQGLDRIMGSSAIAQVSTKVIEINRKDDGIQGIRLWKSRFTPYRHCGIQIRVENMKIRTVYDLSDLPEARKHWNGL